MKKEDTALLIGGTITGMGVVVNAIALECLRENFLRHTPKTKPGKIESVDEMHIGYLRRKGVTWINGQECEDMQLYTSDGLLLKGRYIHNGDATRKEGEPVNIVLLSHGYGGSGFKDMLIFVNYYSRMGYDIMLIDQRSHGRSEGSVITFGALEKGDMTGWIRQLIDKHNGNCRILLHGWSMGAAVAYLAAADGLPEQVRGLVYDCGYSVAEAEFLYMAHKNVYLPKALLWYVMQFMKIWCRLLGGFKMKDASPLFVSKDMKLPVFFVHGGADTCVPAWMGRRLYESTDRTPYRDILIVPDADHTYSYIHDRKGYEAGIQKLIDECMA